MAVGVLLALLAGGCSGGPDAPGEVPPHRPILLIGLDGATWDLVQPWIDEGRLPHFQRLRREGVRGKLWSFVLDTGDAGSEVLSPIIWATIATGREPADHGILDFQRPGPDGAAYTNRDRRTRAVWNILSERGHPSNVVGWFTSWPVDVIQGNIISDRSRGPIRGGHHPPGLETLLERTSASFSLEVAREEAGRFLGPPLEQDGASREERDRLRHVEKTLADMYRVDSLRLTWALELMRNEPAGFTAVFFKGIDAVSHLAWLYMEPELFPARFRPEDGARRRLENAIPAYYEFMDEAIGRLLAAAPPDTNVIVVSDHGFGPGGEQPGDPTYHVNSVLAHLGWLETDPRGHADADRSLAADLAQHWQETRRDRRIWINTERLFGGTAVTGAAEVDGATKTHEIESSEETGDIARPGDLAGRRSRLEALLADLRAVATLEGVPLFEEVRIESVPACIEETAACYVAVRIHPGMEQKAREAPAGSGERYRAGEVEVLLSDFLGLRIGQSGTHRLDGLLLMAGPDIRDELEVEGAGVRDVTPTVLRLLGLPPSREMPGHALEEALRVESLGAPPPVVGTYEDGSPIRLAPVEAGDDVEAEEEKLRRRLKALGYLQ
jgi:predicted AlkP superfamily phosphohydrolase/phosphomutase